MMGGVAAAVKRARLRYDKVMTRSYRAEQKTQAPFSEPA
jgi:hypothetical protein